jgi:hypothetical protein
VTERVTPEYTSPHRARGASGWAVGLILFAGVMMILAGAFHAFSGLVALFENEFYVATPNYLLEFDATSWGWIHLVVGLVVAGAGFGVLSGQTWARVVGIAVAVVSALVNFAFIPHYPLWALVIITLDIFVIWALAAHGRDTVT